MANARWVSRAGSGSSALLRCPASASALERASRCTNRLPCDMANARLVSRAGSGSSALLRCPASASALERASRCTNRLPCDMANARLVSRAGSGSSALLRCPASASALERASRLADRCAKNFSLFLPLAAVEILALHAAQCYAADDELREQQVDDDHGQDGDGDHHIHLAHIELQEVCTA